MFSDCLIFFQLAPSQTLRLQVSENFFILKLNNF